MDKKVEQKLPKIYGCCKKCGKFSMNLTEQDFLCPNCKGTGKIEPKPIEKNDCLKCHYQYEKYRENLPKEAPCYSKTWIGGCDYFIPHKPKPTDKEQRVRNINDILERNFQKETENIPKALKQILELDKK